MTREDFFVALQKLDWHYEMSDSNEAYNRGARQMAQIRAEADQDPVKEEMFLAFCKYYNGSRLTKPTREEFGL